MRPNEMSLQQKEKSVTDLLTYLNENRSSRDVSSGILSDNLRYQLSVFGNEKLNSEHLRALVSKLNYDMQLLRKSEKLAAMLKAPKIKED